LTSRRKNGIKTPLRLSHNGVHDEQPQRCFNRQASLGTAKAKSLLGRADMPSNAHSSPHINNEGNTMAGAVAIHDALYGANC
jgi:hypothetical protein